MGIQKPLSPFELEPEPSPVHHAPIPVRIHLAEQTPIWQPVARIPGPVEKAQVFLIASAHRFAGIAIITLVLALGAIYYRHALYWDLLRVAFIAGDLSLLLGVCASWWRVKTGRRYADALAIVVVSLVVILISVSLIVLARQDRLGDLISRLHGS